MISVKYLSTWFPVDIISVIPFDLMFAMMGNLNKVARFSRIGKMYKLIRMLKIIRLVKIIKVNNKLARHLSDMLKIGAGTERLVYVVLSLFVLQHVTACLWYTCLFFKKKFRILVARFDDTSKRNWIYEKGLIDVGNWELYVSSFYFIVTTLVTVGYGDICAQSVSEKLLCILLMLLGVVAFSFATGSLASILSSYDSKEAQLKEKIATLNDIQNEYNIGIDLFNKLAKTVKYDHSKKQKDTLQFM